MKILIINGSPRKKGHTQSMLNYLISKVNQEIEIINCYETKNIQPCIDCRFCWKKNACSINDGMQEIYQKIDQADFIILASPLYMHTITGPMKIMMDRLQKYWSKVIRKDEPNIRRQGAIILVGGAPSFEDQFTAGIIPLKGILADLECDNIATITMNNTDKLSLSDYPDVREQLDALAKQLNQ